MAHNYFTEMNYDPVTKPQHYCSHPSGIEAISICDKMNFCLGNAFKYLYRCDLKGNTLQDLNKAKWYLERELERRDNFFITWFSEDENYDATFNGCSFIKKILPYENRFGGWMRQALERLYTASVQKRGVLALEAALICVENMISIQEGREGR